MMTEPVDRHLKVFILTLLVALVASAGRAVDYDVVYVRSPQGDWPEAARPVNLEMGSDLYLLHPDGSQETLVDCGSECAVTDPFVTLDARAVLYSRCGDGDGCDVWRVDLGTRERTQLTHGEYEGDHAQTEPVYNLGPAPLPGGRIAFTSNRYGYRPPRRIGIGPPTLQVFTMRDDGGEIEVCAPMNIGSALHPTPMPDGRMMWSTLESQGVRDARQWGLWASYPDCRAWSPIVSAFHEAKLTHFQAATTDGSVCAIQYYNLNNYGHGTLICVPPGESPAFHSAEGGGAVERTFGSRDCGRLVGTWDMPFMPKGAWTPTPFTHPDDHAASCREGSGDAAERVGKVTMPSAAPNNGLLVVWSPGPVNALTRPVNLPEPDSGVYLIPDARVPVTDPWDREQLVELVNESGWNAMYPRAVLPWEAIYGEAMPELPWKPNMTTTLPVPDLPDGTPYGYVGSSSLYKRESFPGKGVAEYGGLDPDNTKQNFVSSNWEVQGADVGLYLDSEIEYLRILALEPRRPQDTFDSASEERTYVLADVPVRKEGVTDPDGNPDTSFLAKIPADTPFTFAMLDSQKRNLAVSMTWHQVRSGEVRVDCGGCHAHSQAPTDFWQTAAGQPGFEPYDATGQPAVTEWADVAPLLARMSGTIHGLDFGGLSDEERYTCLADDEDGDCISSWLSTGKWRQTNQSALVRSFQSRRSRIAWEAFGERLDGWTDDDFPSNNDTIGDFDFESGHLEHDLTPGEVETIARWIDTGAAKGADFSTDTLKPTINLLAPGDVIRFGLADAHSGIDLESLSVTATREVQGRPAGSELADLAEAVADAVWEVAVVGSACPAPGGCLDPVEPYGATVAVRDGAGNSYSVTRGSSTEPPPPDPPVCGDGVCAEEETCETCEFDCGPCPPDPPPCEPLLVIEQDGNVATVQCLEVGGGAQVPLIDLRTQPGTAVFGEAGGEDG